LLAGPLGVMLVVLVAQIVFNVYASLFQWRLGNPERTYIGLDNWIAVFQESQWLDSLARTAVFVLVTVGLQAVGGFSIAYLLYKHVGRIGVLSIILLLPMMISEVAAALTWRLLL